MINQYYQFVDIKEHIHLKIQSVLQRLNRSNEIFQLNKPQQLVSIAETFTQACGRLIQICIN